MRRIVWKALALMLMTAATLLAADKLQDALAALGSNDPSAARQAEKSLAKQRSQAAPLLGKMLVNEEQSGLARFRAARMLADFGDQSAVADLKQALFSGRETDASVRAELIRSLVRLGSSSTLIDYFKQGTEKAPIVNAAIAIGLRGNTDDEAKKTLGALMTNPDPRVAQAAFSAICWTYPSISSQTPSCPTSLGNPAPNSNAPKPNRNLALPQVQSSSAKVSPTAGDEAIMDGLKAKQSSSDPQVRQRATDLLTALSEHYKQD